MALVVYLFIKLKDSFSKKLAKVLQHSGVNLRYFKLRLFNLTEFIVFKIPKSTTLSCKNIGIRKSEFAAKTHSFEDSLVLKASQRPGFWFYLTKLLKGFCSPRHIAYTFKNYNANSSIV